MAPRYLESQTLAIFTEESLNRASQNSMPPLHPQQVETNKREGVIENFESAYSK